jgi:hypothetical protein
MLDLSHDMDEMELHDEQSRYPTRDRQYDIQNRALPSSLQYLRKTWM